MTATLIGLLISDQLDDMAGDPDQQLDHRTEQMIDGYRAQLDAGTDLGDLAKELCLTVTCVHVVHEIAATSITPNGGTRVIEVSAEICRYGFERVTVVAYDSTLRAEHLLSFEEYSEAALDRARTTAATYLATPAGRCVCFPGWDPHCGTKGCNGYYVAPAHTPLVLAGAR